jgi:hypothetical protein
MNYYSCIKALLIGTLFGWTLNASAALVSCDANTLALVENTSACERSTVATQDYLNTNPMTVNAEGFFGFSDWLYLDKDDPAGNGQTGTWMLNNNEWYDFMNIMLVFKDGDGTTLLGFLITPTFTSGDWNSPFTAAYEFPNLCVHHNATRNKPAYDDCSKVKDVSHISYYARGEREHEPPPPPVDVTEPGPTALMILGLCGLMLVRRQALKVSL